MHGIYPAPARLLGRPFLLFSFSRASDTVALGVRSRAIGLPVRSVLRLLQLLHL